MKSFYWLISVAFFASATRAFSVPPGYPVTIYEKELKSCVEVPKFDPAAIRRRQHGPGKHDEIYFTLRYFHRTVTLIIFTNRFGEIHREEVSTRKPISKHFVISENKGNEHTLKLKIEEELEGLSFLACDSLAENGKPAEPSH